jgi:hypothetical protein
MAKDGMHSRGKFGTTRRVGMTDETESMRTNKRTNKRTNNMSESWMVMIHYNLRMLYARLPLGSYLRLCSVSRFVRIHRHRQKTQTIFIQDSAPSSRGYVEVLWQKKNTRPPRYIQGDEERLQR